tara:strand:+ start:67 stop:456 length:390 start_codon:yes stop_codon:yes gene_type:complete
MDTYLYFAGIDGGGGAADGTGQAYLGKAKNLRGVLPISTTTTGIYFDSGKESIGDDAAVDLITVTHANTTTTTGHRCKVIAKALAQAANATPHVNGVVDVIDVDNDIYFQGIREITDDSGFDIVVTLDT